MTHKLKELTETKETSDDFWEKVGTEELWIEEAERQAQAVSEAKLYRPLLLNLDQLLTESSEKKFFIDALQRQVAEEALEFEHTDNHKESMRASLNMLHDNNSNSRESSSYQGTSALLFLG